MIIRIYTDGGCKNNPGPGAWAFLVDLGNKKIEKSGYEENTTNNKMELQAAIQALRYIFKQAQEEQCELYTDSQYLRNGITEWIHSWKSRNWIKKDKKPVLNKELWQELDRLNDRLSVDWKWVKGHSTNALNNRCDALVQKAIKNQGA